MEAAYVGNVGRHLFLNENRNQAIPGPGDFDPRRPFFKYGDTQAIYDVCNCDNSSYNSLQMKLQKRVTHGLDFSPPTPGRKPWTTAKAATVSQTTTTCATTMVRRRSTVPTPFTLMHNWELPFGKGRAYLTNASKAADAVAGGWRFSGITTLYSGVAFTPTISNAPSVNADFNYFRPDQHRQSERVQSERVGMVQSGCIYRAAGSVSQGRRVQGNSARSRIGGVESFAVEGIHHRRKQDR